MGLGASPSTGDEARCIGGDLDRLDGKLACIGGCKYGFIKYLGGHRLGPQVTQCSKLKRRMQEKQVRPEDPDELGELGMAVQAG